MEESGYSRDGFHSGNVPSADSGVFFAAAGGNFERDFAPAFEQDPEEREGAAGGEGADPLPTSSEGTEDTEHYSVAVHLVEDGVGELKFHPPPPLQRYLQAEGLPVALVDGVRRVEAAVGHTDSQNGVRRSYGGVLGVVGAGGVLRPGNPGRFLEGTPLPGLLSGGRATVPWEMVSRYAIWERATPERLVDSLGLSLAGTTAEQQAAGEGPLFYRAKRAAFRPRDENPSDLTGKGRELTNELNSWMQRAEGAVMLRAAEEISLTLNGGEATRAYVVTDGPLVKPGLALSRNRPAGSVILAGFAKTHGMRYLEPDQHESLADLPPLYRTSIFSFYSSRYSFYMRLPAAGGYGLFRVLREASVAGDGAAAVERLSHADDELRLRDPFGGPMSGLVRVELPRYLDLESARDAATDLQCLLPLFASAPYRDSRAPVNLEPIASLEQHLKRLLGNSALIERLIRDNLARAQMGTNSAESA